MTRRSRNENAVNALPMKATKWALAVLVVVVAYVVLQPQLNRWLGWHLPSAAIMVDERPTTETTLKKHRAEQSKSPDFNNDKTLQSADVDETSESHGGGSNSYPLYGILKDAGPNRYQSPAGLIYGPGSEEGHRLKHIAKHLADMPNRTGSHGVFTGDMKSFLVVIDEAYLRANQGVKGTKKQQEGNARIKYEVTFEKVVGFLGGMDGKKKGNSTTNRLRLIVQKKDNALVTAFPY